jgi:hypothetical protein
LASRAASVCGRVAANDNKRKLFEKAPAGIAGQERAAIVNPGGAMAKRRQGAVDGSWFAPLGVLIRQDDCKVMNFLLR